MRNFDTVYSAWDEDKLIGMICAMDDGIMNAYVHYLLVDPDYQGKTVGRTLVEMIKKKCIPRFDGNCPIRLRIKSINRFPIDRRIDFCLALDD